MTTLPNICFIGKAGAGKTTAAELLVKHHGYERLSFAAPLKIMCDTSTDRALLQRVGVGVRELYADAWVNLLRHQLDHEPAGARLVIDDARFVNEILALKMEDFVIVRIAASKTMRVDRLKANGKLQDEAQLEHSSETQLDDYEADFRIVNDSHAIDFEQRLVDVLNKVLS